eukprot:TRINITY_DN9753_c0_g1_i1.p1 TRINITY_DN9753_c0_g1~~TRINITY_DN9753_c0_g1_i1.p1  ORF type:complete len:786 (-),score=119.34 TRINITY_DN9753_c0_g1_i1:32-2389(-)
MGNETSSTGSKSTDNGTGRSASVPNGSSEQIERNAAPGETPVEASGSSSLLSTSQSILNTLARSSEKLLSGSTLDSSAITVVKDMYSHDELDPEVEAIHILGKMFPLYSSSKYASLFGSSEIAAKHHKKLLVDLLPLLRLLAAFQLKANESSIKVSERQDIINKRCWDKRNRLWLALQQLAQSGLALNAFETQISEVWNMQGIINESRSKILESVRRVHYLMDLLPPEERRGTDTEMPVELAEHLKKETYFSLNHYTKTPFYDANASANEVESRGETLWIHDVIPFWDAAIHKRSAIQLWRKGIPLRLRGFVWKQAVGNHLHLTRSQFFDFVSKYDELIRAASSGTETVPSSLEVSVTMIDEGSDAAPTTAPAPSIIEMVPEVPEFFSDRLHVWGAPPPQSFYPSFDSSLMGRVQLLQVDPGTKEVASQIIVSEEDPAFFQGRRTLLGGPPDASYYPQNPINMTIPLSSEPKISVDPATRARHSRSKSRTYQVTRTRSLLPGLTSQIKLDLTRTFSKLKLYTEPEASRDILLVLEAVASLRPHTGYVQGMTYLAGMLLLYMDAADATLCLANLVDLPYLSALFTFNLPEMRRHSELFDQLFEHNLPALHAHFKQLEISDEHWLIDWHLTLFSKAFPLPLVSRIWDCVMLEGPIFIHLATLGILKLSQMTLLQLNFESTLDFLRKISLDQVAGVSVSAIQQAQGTSSTQHIAASPEVAAALFKEIESIQVPPHLLHLVNTLLPAPVASGVVVSSSQQRPATLHPPTQHQHQHHSPIRQTPAVIKML